MPSSEAAAATANVPSDVEEKGGLLLLLLVEAPILSPPPPSWEGGEAPLKAARDPSRWNRAGSTRIDPAGPSVKTTKSLRRDKHRTDSFSAVA